jgi:uncharacterized membrane protein YuzA (DUF378 family)
MEEINSSGYKMRILYKGVAVLLFVIAIFLVYVTALGALEVGKYNEYCIDAIFERGQECIFTRQFYTEIGLGAVFFCILPQVIWFFFYRATCRIIHLYRDAYKD